MYNKRNKLICIGAVHPDYILQFKKNYFKKRTNSVIENISLGGVAYNIASKLSFLNLKTVLISLNCKSKILKKIKKNKIKFISLSKKIYERYYSAILNHKGEMILGLAKMDNYEKKITINKINNYKKHVIIFDLNLSSQILLHLINKFYQNNLICICGTSHNKVRKIKNHLKKINTIILNKQESFNLTKKKTIKDALCYLVKQNNNIRIVITNGKYRAYAYEKNMIYSCAPPKTKIKNENQAGDTMSSLFFYYLLAKSNKIDEVLKKSIVAGSLQASNYKPLKKTYLKKIEILSSKINVKVMKFNG